MRTSPNSKATGPWGRGQTSHGAASGHTFEEGGFIKARHIDVDNLPDMDHSAQKMELRSQRVVRVLKGEDNPEHSILSKIEAVKQYQRLK